MKAVQLPETNRWFDVDPQVIDQRLFEKKREDYQQEQTRQLILEAFNAEKNGRKFKTLSPELKEYGKKNTVKGLKEYACKLGGNIANWREWALELAQRICNGASWKAICNDRDTAEWYRLIEWKNPNTFRCVGYSNDLKGIDYGSASYVHEHVYRIFDNCDYTVPLVVIYEK